MMILVEVDDRQVVNALTKYGAYLRARRPLMTAIGRELRDYVKDTIRMGGRGRSWASLSEWTQRRTGRTQPLQGKERLIRFEANAAEATVFAASTGEGWSLNQHHSGYNIPLRKPGNVMRVKPRRGKAIFFMSAKPAKVPARPFWPSQAEVDKVTKGRAIAFIQEGARQTWR